MSTDNGRAAVADAAITGAIERIASDRAAADGEALELFELPGRTEDPRGARAIAIEHAKRGRPPGAVNKSTAELRRYLLARGVNPLSALMQWAMHTPESLAAELGCTKLEAFDRLRAVWEGLAPYFMPKMVPVDNQGRAVPFFAMNFGLFGAAPAQGGKAPWTYLESEQNQALPAPSDDVSHGMVSHAGEKRP